MSKRLQLLFPDQEMSDIQRLAKRELLPVSDWVRRTLREALANRSEIDSGTKLNSVRLAAAYAFPTADIHQMNNEIQRGYGN